MTTQQVVSGSGTSPMFLGQFPLIVWVSVVTAPPESLPTPYISKVHAVTGS